MRSTTNYNNGQEFLVDIKMNTKYNSLKPRNLVAKDLRTPKYRMRVVESKVSFTRKVKHKKENYAET